MARSPVAALSLPPFCPLQMAHWQQRCLRAWMTSKSSWAASFSIASRSWEVGLLLGGSNCKGQAVSAYMVASLAAACLLLQICPWPLDWGGALPKCLSKSWPALTCMPAEPDVIEICSVWCAGSVKSFCCMCTHAALTWCELCQHG